MSNPSTAVNTPAVAAKPKITIAQKKKREVSVVTKGVRA